jgi:hypothetical protein
MRDARHRIWVASIFMLLTFAAAVFCSWTAATRQLSALEAALTQCIVLTFGLLSSFLFGQLSAEKAGQDMIRSHAKSAFRRVLSLYRSLSRLAAIIENDRETNNGRANSSRATFDKLEAIVVEQIATADDALADWKDICPQEVERMIRIGDTRPEVGNE